jgi:hypothetical protein
VLVFLALSSRTLESAAQVPEGLSQPLDTVFAGCSGGVTGGGGGLAVTGRGEILKWQLQGPRSLSSAVYTAVGTDSATAAAIFAELARVRFRSIDHQKPSNMTCFIALAASAGTHSVSWPIGNPPMQLRELHRLLQVLGESVRGVPSERATPATRDGHREPGDSGTVQPGQTQAAPTRLECGRGRMRPEDSAACRERFTNFLRAWLLIGVPLGLMLSLILSRRSALPRLAGLYPAVPSRNPSQRIFASRLVVGKGFYKNATWLRVDDSYLHVSGLGPCRLWMPKFSVPWSDISATSDDYPWGLWDSRVIRLTFARDPSVRFMVWPSVFDQLVEASEGRLRPLEPQPASRGVDLTRAR